MTRAIPKSTRLKVIKDAGNRCAVCGHSSPVVLCHITPYSQSKDNSYDNLLAVCPNCHFRADTGTFTSEELREYKEKPWVKREESDERTTVKLTLNNIDFDDFGDELRESILKTISQFLEISESEIKIERVEKG